MSDGKSCSFCGKFASEVFRLIAGRSCNICSECVGRSANIIATEFARVSSEIIALPPPLPPGSQGGAS